MDDMHPIFYAFGPVFRENFLGEPFDNIDIYPLISHILQLNERKTNGSFDHTKSILREELFYNKLISTWSFSVILCILSVIFLGVIYIIVAYRHSHQLIYIDQPIRYRLLSTNEESMNNFVLSDDEI